MARQPAADDPHTQRQIAALVAAQAVARARLNAQAVALAQQRTRQFRDWYNADAVAAWAVGMASAAEALQRAVALSTDAYLARVMTLLLGKPVRPLGAVDVTALRRDVTHAGAYGRVANAYRYQQHLLDRVALDLLDGGRPRPPSLVTPVDAAVERATVVADLDTQLAFREQSQTVMAEHAARGDTTGYRRVIHPERSKGGSCGLCIVASDRRYGPTEPMPIHARCECTTLPITTAGADPGSTLNTADLSRLYSDAGDNTREALKRTRYRIDDHGELGAVLSPREAKRQRPRTARQNDRPPLSDAEKHARVIDLRDRLGKALPQARQLGDTDPKWSDYAGGLGARVADLDRQLAA